MNDKLKQFEIFLYRLIAGTKVLQNRYKLTRKYWVCFPTLTSKLFVRLTQRSIQYESKSETAF